MTKALAAPPHQGVVMDLISKSYVLLSPEYEEEFQKRYGKQPRFIPTDFVSNNRLPAGINSVVEFSRKWMANPKLKKRKNG